MTMSISPEETRQALNSTEYVAVIDTREPLDYAEGHIPESTLVPRTALETRLPWVVPNRAVTVILCDQRGDRAEFDASWLDYLGYETVQYIDGGMEAWYDAGLDTIEAYEGVFSTAFNFPSKDFGEKIQVQEKVTQIQPTELNNLVKQSNGPDPVIADVRTPEEYESETIPGAVNIEGVDLGLYIDQVRDPEQPVVVHCAGRTRSIIGSATLQKLGVENVYELENGTMGWDLAGFDLEHGADRHVTGKSVDEDTRSGVQSKAESLLDKNDIPLVSVNEFRALREDPDKAVYAVDVRTRSEYEQGHIPRSIGIPGGQAIQTANEHFAVQNATIVFISDHHTRAAITAYWFGEMGYPNVMVLEDGIHSWESSGFTIRYGEEEFQIKGRSTVDDLVSVISPAELADQIESGAPVVVDVGSSTEFEESHIPEAKWVPRYYLEEWLKSNYEVPEKDLVLVCQTGTISRYAAAAIQYTLDLSNVTVLDGGTNAWISMGEPVQTGSDELIFEPRDDVPKPYHQGDWAKATYLEWEERLGEKYA